MKEILLDGVIYSKTSGLVSHAIAYTYEKDAIIKLGMWCRKDIINAIEAGEKISRADISANVEGNYVGQHICQIVLKEIEGEMYLLNSNYLDKQKKEDMIEMNVGLKQIKGV